MDPTPVEFNPHSIEMEVVALWKARRLPTAGGIVGPPGGPVVRQFAGSWTHGGFVAPVAHRAVLADVEARYLMLAGRRASGTLREDSFPGSTAPSPIPAVLSALGIWSGGDGRNPWDSEDRSGQVQAMAARLARKEIFVTRDEAFRICPSCGTLRSPERIVYDEREGDTYLVRFPVRIRDEVVNALVWVDAPWKLLGASALLLNPNLLYAIAEYRRRDDRELVLSSSPSLERLRGWIPESALHVVEERPGREFHGIPYTYPLRHEFPMGGELAPPAGTLLGAADVGESGTGIVPLVPGHGPTDARIADRLGVTGWPLLTAKGRLDFTLMHKYAGLDLETTNEFVVRDLAEAGALLAHLRVKRGVPYCAICGTALLWAPARAWCLEPSRLPPDRRALFAKLLPHDSLPGPSDVAPWPVSESNPSDEPDSVSLLECSRCERLDATDGAKECPCGAPRTVVRRRILPSMAAALSAWARVDPFPEGDSVHLYLGQRRRVPSLVHQLVALSGVDGTVGDITLTVVPTCAQADLSDSVQTYGADVVRAAIVGCEVSDSGSARFDDRCRREFERLRRWWALARDVLALCDRATIAELARPIGGFLSELETEDRAIVARWERTRVQALAQYDKNAAALVHRRVSTFLDNDLVEYRELVWPRLRLAGSPPTKRAAMRTLVYLLRGTSELLAPIVPFLAESIHRSVSVERTSLFERALAGVDRAILNDDLVAAWERWRSVLRSVDRFRRSFGVSRSVALPSLVLVLPADDVADRLRAEKDVLARLTRVQRVIVGSPREPWNGRQRVMRPVESEIQKVYPTQASQIVHLLQRVVPRPRAPGAPEEELSVVIDSYPVRVYPSMISIVEMLPKRMVPVAWSLGEMYVEVPADAESRRASLPPLSPDAFWLVRRLDRRLRAAPLAAGLPPRVAIVTVKDPLASELRAAGDPIARALGLGEFRVVEASEGAVPPTAVTGRTRTGDRWSVHVPGLPGPRSREKRPRPGGRTRRVTTPAPAKPAEEVDYADEKVVAREQAVRALGQELDDIIGIPLLGPAKIAVAWDQGLHSVDDLRAAPFETVSALPGFGGPVAAVVISKIGGSVTEGELRAARRRTAETLSTEPPPATRPPSPSVPTPSLTAAPPPPVLEVPPAPPALPPPAEIPPALAAEVPASNVLSEPPSPELTPPTESPPEEPAIPLVPPTAVLEAVEPTPAAEAPAIEEIPPPTPAEPTPPVSGPEPPPEPVPSPPAPAPEAPVEPPLEPKVEEPTAESTVVPPSAPPPPEPSTAPEVSTVPRAELAEETPAPGPEPELPITTKEAAIESGPSSTTPLVEESTGPPTAPAPEDVKAAPETIVSTSEEAPPEPSPENEAEVSEEVPVPSSAPVDEEVPASAAEPPAPSLPPSGEENVEEAPAEEAVPSVPEPESEPEPVPPPEREAGGTASAPPATEVLPETPSPPGPSVAEEAALLSVPEPEPSPEIPPPPAAPTEPLRAERAPEPTLVEPPTPSASAEAMAPPTPPVPPAAEPVPPPSGVELAVGEPLFVALGGFLDSTSAGHRGVCVVREPPERIRTRVGSRPIEVYWLSNLGRGPSLRPADLPGLWAFLTRMLSEEHATAFFLEGIEYLVRLHGTDAVLTGLVELDRLARENDARIWLCLTPALLKPADLERFRATFGTSAGSR